MAANSSAVLGFKLLFLNATNPKACFFLLTIRPLLFFIKSSFLSPPLVFSALPCQTIDFDPTDFIVDMIYLSQHYYFSIETCMLRHLEVMRQIPQARVWPFAEPLRTECFVPGIAHDLVPTVANASQ